MKAYTLLQMHNNIYEYLGSGELIQWPSLPETKDYIPEDHWSCSSP